MSSVIDGPPVCGLGAGNDYFDRQGRPIDLMTWAGLWKDAAYRFVERTWIVKEVLEVVTVWEGFDPYRVNFEDAPPRIFRVAELHWRDGKLSQAREHAMLATEPEATAAHQTAVSILDDRRHRS